MYLLKNLIWDCAHEDSSIEDYKAVWACVCSMITEQFSVAKGCKIPGLGSFTVIRNSEREGKAGFKGAVFILSEPFSRSYGAHYKRPGSGLTAPVQEFNYARVCIQTGLDKDAVHNMINNVVHKLGTAINKGESVKIAIGSIGHLTSENRKVNFHFSPKYTYTGGNLAPKTARTDIGDKINQANKKKGDYFRRLSSSNMISKERAKNVSQNYRKKTAANSKSISSIASSSISANESKEDKPSLNNFEDTMSVTGLNINNTMPSKNDSNIIKASQQEDKQELQPPYIQEQKSKSQVPGPALTRKQSLDLGVMPGNSIFPSFTTITSPNKNVYHPTLQYKKAQQQEASQNETNPTLKAIESAHKSQKVMNTQAAKAAFSRMEGIIEKKRLEEERLQSQMLEYTEKQEAEAAKSREFKLKKQAEWREYLLQQAEDDKRTKQAKHEEEFLSKAPETVTAYPQRGSYDVNKFKHINRDIAKTLDEQIQRKKLLKLEEQKKQLELDDKLIKWVYDEDEKERKLRLKRKQAEREILFKEWELQTQINNKIRSLGPTKIV